MNKLKLLLFTDNHYCESSSIIRFRGNKYSVRLENQIASLNWVENLALKENCNAVICLGDFFDKSILTDEELSALKEINWNNLEHYFIVGNHESSINTLEFNSVNALNKSTFKIVDKPLAVHLQQAHLLFLPYIIEDNRKSLTHYLNIFAHNDYNINDFIVLSHNDIKGIQMGPIISQTGFDIKEIENTCKLFLNGHLHNGIQFCKNGYNLGNLTGLNFGEDALKYKHCAVILEIDEANNYSLRYIENPFAFNFVKKDILKEEDINTLFNQVNNKNINNLCFSFKCSENLVDKLNNNIQELALNKNVVYYRITPIKHETTIEVDKVEEFSVDHIKEFIKCCKENISNSDILNKELEEVCK